MPHRRRETPKAFRITLVSFGCASLLLLSAARSGGIAAIKYPDWFVRTPVVSGVRMAVGYAPIYGDTSLSIQEALENGKAALRVGTAVRVRAEYLQEVLTNGNVAYRGELYMEDTLAAENVRAVAADTVFMSRMALVLVASHDAPAPRQRRVTLSKKPPAWVSLTPSSADGVYGIGIASTHFNEYEAWMEAERQARRSLAFAHRMDLRSAVESRTGGTSQGALIASTSMELRDVQVRERWRDAHRMFVLVHARVVNASAR